MGLTSTYVFDQTDLRGNFSYTNIALLDVKFSESASNAGSTSMLVVARERRELLIDLYDRFNQMDFFYLIDIGPEINGISTTANAGALMFLISSRMKHYGYRSSDIRAGWMEWRYIPYHNMVPGRHQDSDLLNQIAFNFHIDRGFGTVDNDGWIAFYFLFSLDGTGRLSAQVDGWAYHAGGGGGLPDNGPDIGGVLNIVIPQFIPTIQSFLDSFGAAAGRSSWGAHDSSGQPLFDQFYLLPGSGDPLLIGPNDIQSGYPAPRVGTSTRPVDAQVTLALVPTAKKVPHGTPDILWEIKRKGWRWELKASSDAGVSILRGTRKSNGKVFEIEARVTERQSAITNAAPTRAPKTRKPIAKKKVRRQ